MRVPLTCLTGKNKEKALWIWRRHFSIFHLLRWKCIRKKNDLLILDTPTAVQVFLFLAYLVNYAKVIALKGKARKHQKLLHFRLLFFWRKKVTYHCFFALPWTVMKKFCFCALHTLLLQVKSWKWRVQKWNESRKAVIRDIHCLSFMNSNLII